MGGATPQCLPIMGVFSQQAVYVTSAESLATFRQQPKTHLLTKSFPGCFLDVK